MLLKPKSNRQSPETQPIIKKRISTKEQKPIQDASFKELYKQQKLAEIVQKAMEDKDFLYEEYDEITISGEVIKLNDKVIIKNEDRNVDDYIGEKEKFKLICLCELYWFMRRNEKICHKPRACSTNTNDYKCTVVDCEEYFNMENLDSTTYYNRLEWVVKTKRFTYLNTVRCIFYANSHEIQNSIIFKQYFYVYMCDKCQKWYHFQCVGLKEENKGYVREQCD